MPLSRMASTNVVEELWEYAFDAYHRMCKEVEPDSPSDENRRLMQVYFSKRHSGSP